MRPDSPWGHDDLTDEERRDCLLIALAGAAALFLATGLSQMLWPV